MVNSSRPTIANRFIDTIKSIYTKEEKQHRNLAPKKMFSDHIEQTFDQRKHDKGPFSDPETAAGPLSDPNGAQRHDTMYSELEITYRRLI